jgi:hypothetical protein
MSCSPPPLFSFVLFFLPFLHFYLLSCRALERFLLMEVLLLTHGYP